MEKIEYRVRPVTRYIVTRYSEGDNSVGCETKGEFDNPQTSYAVAYALCKLEHEKSGLPLASDMIIYPKPPDDYQGRSDPLFVGV